MNTRYLPLVSNEQGLAKFGLLDGAKVAFLAVIPLNI